MSWELIDMDEMFPPHPEVESLELQELFDGAFVPVTRQEWRELHEPQPDIAQL